MKTLIDLPTSGDVKEALQNLAKGAEGLDGLDKIYEQAMERVVGQEKGSRNLANWILAWIIHAKRPLSTSELRHALAVRPGTTVLDKNYVPSLRVVRSVCAGLITVDEESDIIRLI